jgi:transcriptional regulator with XRE-family HTH domain
VTAQSVPPVFGRRLRAERERRDLTLRQLATACRVNANTVLRAEQGRDVALSIASALAAGLGLPLSALLAELKCGRCDGTPPAGFICGECGRTRMAAVNDQQRREDER